MEMSKHEPEPQPKRGAPRGNKNALKNGFYARALTPEEQRDSSAATGRFRDEINLLKVLVYRIALSIKTPEAGNRFFPSASTWKPCTHFPWRSPAFIVFTTSNSSWRLLLTPKWMNPY